MQIIKERLDIDEVLEKRNKNIFKFLNIKSKIIKLAEPIKLYKNLHLHNQKCSILLKENLYFVRMLYKSYVAT